MLETSLANVSVAHFPHFTQNAMLIVYCKIRLLIFRREIRIRGSYLCHRFDATDAAEFKSQPAQVETWTGLLSGCLMRSFRELYSHTSYLCSHGKVDQYLLAPSCGCQLPSAWKIDFFVCYCFVLNAHRLGVRNKKNIEFKSDSVTQQVHCEV